MEGKDLCDGGEEEELLNNSMWEYRWKVEIFFFLSSFVQFILFNSM